MRTLAQTLISHDVWGAMDGTWPKCPHHQRLQREASARQCVVLDVAGS